MKTDPVLNHAKTTFPRTYGPTGKEKDLLGLNSKLACSGRYEVENQDAKDQRKQLGRRDELQEGHPRRKKMLIT